VFPAEGLWLGAFLHSAALVPEAIPPWDWWVSSFAEVGGPLVAPSAFLFERRGRKTSLEDRGLGR
jgi:hypothetical protein